MTLSIKLHFHNVCLLTISFSSLYLYLNQLIYNIPVNYLNIQKIIFFYSFFDLIFTPSIAAKFHHLFTIGIIYYCYFYKILPIDCKDLISFYLKTETTSIFLVLRYYIKKEYILYKINIFIFYSLFFKIRIYDNYFAILSSESTLIPIVTKYSNLDFYNNVIIYVSCYGLFLINIYWFMLMSYMVWNQIKLRNQKKLN